MRLYHFTSQIALILLLLTSACATPQATPEVIQVQVVADGVNRNLQLASGSTVGDAIETANLTLSSLDRVDPPLHTHLENDGVVEIVRVEEEFEVEQEIIPFEQQLQPSELLPEGDMQPLQLGENGLLEITYRIVYEDGEEVSRTPIKTVIVEEALPQIMLVGVQTAFVPLTIPGRLVFLSDGNAWVMENTTGERRAIITSGDLDGRIFSLSENGEWLLFTKLSESEEEINELWVVNLDDPEIIVDLEVRNVIHFAAWVGDSDRTVAFSTVEPRQAAPGWQANNDFVTRTFSPNGWVTSLNEIVETNSGGVYGWWGTDYVYSPDGLRIVSTSPDQIDILDFQEESRTPILEITPLQTGSDWAWVPGVGWGADGEVLFTVDHTPPPGTVSPEESPNFDLTGIPLGGPPIHLVSDVGMFAYPLPSPMLSTNTQENAYWVAYLQAIFPTQSESSRYRLVVMDRDGSNREEIFPPEEQPGLNPQREWGVWSPEPLQEGDGYVLAVLYQGNLWLVDVVTGENWQVTGDGRINRVDWK